MNKSDAVRLIRPDYYTKDDIANSKNQLYINKEDYLFKTNYEHPNYHKHELLGVEYFYKGECTQYINGQEYVCGEGSVTILSPLDVHRFKFKENLPTTQYYLYFIDSLVLPELHKYMDYEKLPIITTIENPETRKHMNNLFERLLNINSLKRSEQSQILSKILVNEIILTAIMNGVKSDTIPRKPSRITEITNFINKSFSEQLTAYNMADTFHMNQDYFLKYFKKHMGITFTEYLTKVRMEYAKRLLLTTEMSMSDIAISCGLGSPSYFSKVFKNHFGQKPSHFRTMQNEKGSV